MFDIDEIKRRLSCRELLAMHGYSINRKNKCRCAFHDDTKPSMQVYDDGYHCFSCGAHGDVIDLAAQLYGVDNREAIRITAELARIAAVSDTKEYANRARIARQKARERTERIEKLKVVYYKLIAEYRRLEMNRERYAPRSPTETELHPLFRESLNRLAVIEDALQRCEWAIIDAERK